MRFSWDEVKVPTSGKELTNFAIAAADQKFAWADAEIVGDKIVVSSPEIPQPKAVRFCFNSAPFKYFNFDNKEGPPASPFITDEWYQKGMKIMNLTFYFKALLLVFVTVYAEHSKNYIHPKSNNFTDFKIISPLPERFVKAYPKRKEMGDQYLDFYGTIAIVGETENQRTDMKRLAHVLMGLIDNDQDGLPDDKKLWKKLKEKVSDKNRLVLYVSEKKEKYKSFDGEHPSVYHQGWSSFRDGERLHLSNIQEELFHFLQRYLWEIEYPKSFGLDRNPRSIAHNAAVKAVKNEHYVYDLNCISDSGCLVPEFFFCAMTDIMKGWQGDGFEAPAKDEWRLKGNINAISKHYPDMMKMIEAMQKEGKLPKNWPSFFLIKKRKN